MRLRVNQVAEVLRDEMNQLTLAQTDLEAGGPQWSHDTFGMSDVVSTSREYLDWVDKWMSWGQPRDKREWLRNHFIEVAA